MRCMMTRLMNAESKEGLAAGDQNPRHRKVYYVNYDRSPIPVPRFIYCLKCRSISRKLSLGISSIHSASSSAKLTSQAA